MEALLDSEPEEFSLMGEPEFRELRALLAEAPALFEAPTTRNHEKKKIIGLLVKRFAKGPRTREAIPGRIVWSTGEPDTSVKVPLAGRAHGIIAELLARKMNYQAIAYKLNEMGLVTSRLSKWTIHAVGAAARSIRSRTDEN